MKRFYPLLLLSGLICSCNGQDKTVVAETNILSAEQAKTWVAGTHCGNVQPYNIQCSFRDKAGNTWFGTTGGQGIFRCDSAGKFTNFSEKDGLCNKDVYSIYEDKSGNLWFGTLAGASRYDGKNFTTISLPVTEGSGIDPLWRIPNRFPPHYFPSSKSVLSILQDQKGDFWFGTAGAGVYRYDQNCVSGKSLNKKDSTSCFSNFLYNNFSMGAMIHKDHLLRNGISCILEDKSGNIWFGSYSHGGVYRYEPATGEFINFTLRNGLRDDMITALLEDRNGNIWIGSRNWLISRFDPATGRFTHYFEKELLGMGAISCIFEDKSGNTWFGSHFNSASGEGSLCRYDGEKFSNQSKEHPEIFNVMTISEDKSGNLWLGTGGGKLWKYTSGSGKFVDFSGKVGGC